MKFFRVKDEISEAVKIVLGGEKNKTNEKNLT
jgi:hypothetical protein